jgi:Domain of unknown function (DUF4287)
MPTQKIFKQRVRARMTKTGESYAAARRHLLRKTTEPPAEPAVPPEAAVIAAGDVPPEVRTVSEESMVRATGRSHAEWFALLDAWGGTDHSHTEIARWLSDEHDVRAWWTQSVTVAYERARGMRAVHQMTNGFSVSATKTVSVPPAVALEAFTNEAIRARWLKDGELRPRPSRATRNLPFDWDEPPSRVVVVVAPKGDDRALVSVTHEQLPDAESAATFKAAWRARLVEYKRVVET